MHGSLEKIFEKMYRKAQNFKSKGSGQTKSTGLYNFMPVENLYLLSVDVMQGFFSIRYLFIAVYLYVILIIGLSKA